MTHYVKERFFICILKIKLQEDLSIKINKSRSPGICFWFNNVVIEKVARKNGYIDFDLICTQRSVPKNNLTYKLD